MADLQPPDAIPPVSSADPPPTPISAPPAPSSPPPPPPPPPVSSPPPPPLPSHLPDIPTSAPPPAVLAPKRQRRPSVRLGEIGHQSLDTPSHHPRRPSKTWRFHRDPSLAAKASKTRPLTNLVNGAVTPASDPHDNPHPYTFDLGTKRTKPKKPPTKRARSNWASAPKFEPPAAPNGALTLPQTHDCAFRHHDNQEHDDFPDFQPEEGSQSPLKLHSPVHSQDINHNAGLHFWDRRAGVRARRRSRSDSLDPDLDRRENDLNFDHPFNGIHNDFNSGDHNISCGVRDWLTGLGLGRYAPVFEIHEVDDEVLPMLTLEDLKDMGINAVGSRRKMYSSIVKLRKRFS